jgi:hypothetical protein
MAERRRERGPAKGAGRAAPRPAPAQEEGAAPACTVAFCPLCAAVTALGEARPEVAEHLLRAGRELLLALRALVDARLEGSRSGPRLERVPVD